MTEDNKLIEIRDLNVSVDGKEVLKDLNLSVSAGETVVLFGPNGSGKTSLLKTIMGIPGYRVDRGSILFKGRDITSLPTDERARLGIGMAFQRPPAVRGVKLRDVLKACLEKRRALTDEEIDTFARRLNLLDFLGRDLNCGFSGGEIKRSELLQLLAQSPEFVMLDEPDSGVDLVNINTVASAINRLLEKDKRSSRRTKAGLIITHAGYILDYVNADKAYIMISGRILCSGNPRDLLKDIRTKGYEECAVCQR